MTKSEALARIFETYTEEELLLAKDEPEADVTANFGGATNVVDMFDGGQYAAHATRARVKQAFRNAGHGTSAADALINAKQLLKQDGIR